MPYYILDSIQSGHLLIDLKLYLYMIHVFEGIESA
jgi:hypothetical protein